MGEWVVQFFHTDMVEWLNPHKHIHGKNSNECVNNMKSHGFCQYWHPKSQRKVVYSVKVPELQPRILFKFIGIVG